MTGAKEPSLAMTDTEHVGHVHLLGQHRTQTVTGDGVFYSSLLALSSDQLLALIPKKQKWKGLFMLPSLKENKC